MLLPIAFPKDNPLSPFLAATTLVTSSGKEVPIETTVKVKRFLNSVMQEELGPIRERRLEWQAKLPEVVKILEEGTKKAYATAEKTLDEVKSSMKINYFKDNSLI